MDKVEIYRSKRIAKIYAEEFYREHTEEIYSANMAVVFFFCMKDGSRMFFLTPLEYDWWCKGKTYYMDGIKYHSGTVIEDDE